MHLKGNFETSFLASILQLLCNDAKTGVLRLTKADQEVKIFILEGAVIYAVGSHREARLGQLLVGKGVITEEQLHQSLTAARVQKQALGKMLISQGLISAENLNQIIQKQAEEVIFSLFLWTSGQFEYRDAKLDLKGMVVAPLNIMNIILEASRRIDEMSILRQRITSDDIVLRISGRVQEKKEIKFKSAEWRMLTLIDGHRTVRQLVVESGFDDFTVYKVLYSLLSYGVVEQVEAPPPADPPGDARDDLLKIWWQAAAATAAGLDATRDGWSYLPHPPAGGVRAADAHRAARDRWIHALLQGAPALSDTLSAMIVQRVRAGETFEQARSDLLACAGQSGDADNDALQRLGERFHVWLAELARQAATLLEPAATARLLKAYRQCTAAADSDAASDPLHAVRQRAARVVATAEEVLQHTPHHPRRGGGTLLVATGPEV